MSDEIKRDYERLAEMFRLGETVPLTKDEVDFAEVEARKRGDSDILAEVAYWYEDNGDKKRYLEIADEAAAIGSAKANFWLGCEYRSGENLPRDYEKAYAHYLKAEDWDWAPIDPGENLEAMRSLKEDGVTILEIYDPKVIAGILLDADGCGSTIEESIPWWEFVLGKHPSRALKFGLGNWYVSVGEFDKGARLIEESANEGFCDASSMLAIYYADDSHKDIDRARYWLKEAEKAGAKLPRTAKKLGVECEAIRRLKEDAQAGDLKAAAVLAAAYYHGSTDGRCGEPIYCERDMRLAREYGEKACEDNEGADLLFDLLDTNKKDERAFICELTQHLEVEDTHSRFQETTDDNELVQDEEGNWMYRGDLED